MESDVFMMILVLFALFVTGGVFIAIAFFEYKQDQKRKEVKK